MFANRITLYMVRSIRLLRKRAIEHGSKAKENLESIRKVLPMSVTDLQKLEKNNEQILPLSEADLQKLDEQYKMEYSSVNKAYLSEANQLDNNLNKPIKRIKKNLLDFKIELPLQEPITQENQYEKLNQVVTPLYKKPYHKQLLLKHDNAVQVLFSLKKLLREYKVPLGPSHNKLPCPLEKIYPSPDIVKYRSKDEFSVHIGVDGNPKTVGYFVSTPKDPLMRCVNPTHLINVRDSHKLIAQQFQNFIQSSQHKPCFNFKEGGVWRNLLVRSTLKDERMAAIKIFPTEEKEEIKEHLRKFFFHGQGAECQLTSLYLQSCPHARCTRETAPYELIEGQEYITEECLGKTILISPDSFSHTNVKAAELLYEAIKKISEVSPVTTLLEISCGIGTIGNFLASSVRGVIGIDVVKGAIDDAKANAKINNILNTNYIPGQVENIISILISDLEDCTEVVAIVNPARRGLTPSVIETIRNCKSIKKLVYICNTPEGNTATNMALLGSTLPIKKSLTKRRLVDPGDPFVPTYAVQVDMLPHTCQSEYVILFERVELS